MGRPFLRSGVCLTQIVAPEPTAAGSDVLATEQAAQNARHARLDAADYASYKAERESTETPVVVKPVGERVDPVAEEGETADAKAARERDEQGRFKGAKPRDDPSARKESIQAEINRATWEKKEAERQREQASRELDQIRQETARLKADATAPTKPAQEPAKAAGFPAYEAWLATTPEGTYEDYLDARAEHRIEQRFAAERQKVEQSQRAQQFTERHTAHEARVTEAKAKYPDWDVHAQATANVPVPDVMYEAILGSDRSADLVYYLVTHPEEYTQLAKDASALSVEAAPLMRRLLEAQIPEAAAQATGPVAPVRQSRANPPPKPVGGSPSAPDVDLDSLSPDEYRRVRNQQEQARRTTRGR